jgi:hypothetical protein
MQRRFEKQIVNPGDNLSGIFDSVAAAMRRVSAKLENFDRKMCTKYHNSYILHACAARHVARDREICTWNTWHGHGVEVNSAREHLRYENVK